MSIQYTVTNHLAGLSEEEIAAVGTADQVVVTVSGDGVRAEFHYFNTEAEANEWVASQAS